MVDAVGLAAIIIAVVVNTAFFFPYFNSRFTDGIRNCQFAALCVGVVVVFVFYRISKIVLVFISPADLIIIITVIGCGGGDDDDDLVLFLPPFFHWRRRPYYR